MNLPHSLESKENISPSILHMKDDIENILGKGRNQEINIKSDREYQVG
jgi:hypothetical protein